MYKDGRYINAGTNEFYRWGHRAQEKLSASLIANDAGYYSVQADGGKYWTLGTSQGKHGTYIKFEGTFLSVNSGGFVYAKARTEKGEVFVKMINSLINTMKAKHMKSADSESEEKQ